jgi:hypothetical protein
MIFLLLGTALAQDVAPKPEAREPLAGQCVESTPVSAPCGGVIVPTTTAADLLDIEIWGDQLYSQYTLDQKAWALQQDALTAENKKLRTTVWIRAAEGLLIGLAAGYATYAVIDARSR